MIDVSAKDRTLRTAVASTVVRMAPDTAARVRAGDTPKGDPLPVARVAAVQAVKDTPRIIPFCHPISVTGVNVDFEVGDAEVRIVVTARCVDRTGIEVEAMTGAAVAALTLYDMLKMIDDAVSVGSVELVEKRGGKSDVRRIEPGSVRAAVLVLSDTVAAGEKQDLSGRLIRERLEAEGFAVTALEVLPDEPATAADRLRAWADDDRLDLVITTGGTGFGPRDTTPEAMADVIERDAPGLAEAVRVHGGERTPRAMLSRARAGLRGTTLIVNLPGSRGGVAEGLDALFPALHHAFPMIRGGGHDHDTGREAGS